MSAPQLCILGERCRELRSRCSLSAALRCQKDFHVVAFEVLRTLKLGSGAENGRSTAISQEASRRLHPGEGAVHFRAEMIPSLCSLVRAPDGSANAIELWVPNCEQWCGDGIFLRRWIVNRSSSWDRTNNDACSFSQHWD